ncbi:MAG: DUF3892 domain-containing protein [Gordonia polyisoprenivorans]|nr:DUF3892 domain-containing protein [Gordonia polyisoprenivorans]
MIEITNRRLSPPTQRDYQHITHLRWFERGTTRADSWTRKQMVEWIDGGGRAVVRGQYGDVDVITVHPLAGEDFVRTETNGTPTDNLLNLPSF